MSDPVSAPAVLHLSSGHRFLSLCLCWEDARGSHDYGRTEQVTRTEYVPGVDPRRGFCPNPHVHVVIWSHHAKLVLPPWAISRTQSTATWSTRLRLLRCSSPTRRCGPLGRSPPTPEDGRGSGTIDNGLPGLRPGRPDEMPRFRWSGLGGSASFLGGATLTLSAEGVETR